MDITDRKSIVLIDSYLKKKLSPLRYRHSVSTAETASMMCEKFGVDKNKGYAAGLIHDIAREFKADALLKYSAGYGGKISGFEIKSPVILHGRAGAVIARDKFGIKDSDVLESIAYHTTGRAGMGTLSKIIFIADHIEPARSHITCNYMKSLEGMALDSILKTVLISVLDYTGKKYKNTSRDSIKLLEELDSEKK